MVRAAISFPTPLSPVIRTFASDFAAHSPSDPMVRMARLAPIRLSMVKSTLFPLLGLEAYQRAAKGENAPKVRTDGTMVAFADWNARHTNSLESTVDAMVDNRPRTAISGAQPNRGDAAQRIV